LLSDDCFHYFETLLGHVYVDRLSKEEKTLLDQMIKNIVKPSQFFLTIKDQDQTNVTTIKTKNNACQKYHGE